MGINNIKAVVLGTGGASWAISQFLLVKNIKDITYISRNPEEKPKELKYITR